MLFRSATAVKLVQGKNQTHDEGIAELTRVNVQIQVNNVAGLEVVQHAWKEGRDLEIVGWLYVIETGLLSDLGICVGPGGKNCTS